MSDISTRSLLRIKQVSKIIGVSRSTIYNWIARGDFPKPKQLGPRAVAWDSDDISDWMKSRPTA
jgi:prophage regulatory protein